MKFPKTVYYVPASNFDDNDDDDDCLILRSDLHLALEGEEDGKQVAVYELKKVGTVTTKTSVKFHPLMKKKKRKK